MNTESISPVAQLALKVLLSGVDTRSDLKGILFVCYDDRMIISTSTDDVMDIDLSNVCGRISLIGGSRQQVNLHYANGCYEDEESYSTYNPLVLDLSNTDSLEALSVYGAFKDIVPGVFPIKWVSYQIMGNGFDVPPNLFKLNGGSIDRVYISSHSISDGCDKPEITIPEGSVIHTLSLTGKDITSVPDGICHLSDHLHRLVIDCQYINELNLNQYDFSLEDLCLNNLSDTTCLKLCNRTGAESIEVTTNNDGCVIPKEFFTNMKRTPKSVHLGRTYPEDGSRFFSGDLTEEFALQLTSTTVPSYLVERKGVTTLLLSKCNGVQHYLDNTDLSDSIHTVSFDHCNVTSIPEWFDKCNNILKFNMSHNPITRFPLQMMLNNIDCIRHINVAGTNIENIPYQVTQTGEEFTICINPQLFSSLFPGRGDEKGFLNRHYFPSREGDTIHKIFVGSRTKAAKS